jgi:SHS2 domain-containing protein
MRTDELPGWEHFEHGADVGVRGRGRTLEEAFAQAACALCAVVVDPALVHPVVEAKLSCEGPDVELLLVAWLDAVIWEMSARRSVFSDFRVRISGTRLEGVARGEPLDHERHQPAVEIKGATHTLLAVLHGEGGGWMVQTVVDV